MPPLLTYLFTNPQVDSKVTVDLHEFLAFARAFGERPSEIFAMEGFAS